MISKILMAALFLIIVSPFSAYADTGTIPVDADGTQYTIDFDSDGVEIISMEGDGDLALLLEVSVTDQTGTLELTFDRELFDSTFEGVDDSFFIILDGFDEAVFEESSTSTTRTLIIELPSGTEEVEIIGSQILDATFGDIMTGEALPEPEPEVMEEPEPEVMEEPEVLEEPEPVNAIGIPEPEVMEEPEATTECGPGTILKDGVCVLEETCGPGTHLEDGICVLDEKSSGVTLTDRSTSTQFMVGAIAAFVIAFIVMIILWIISRGSRQKTTAKPNYL